MRSLGSVLRVGVGVFSNGDLRGIRRMDPPKLDCRVNIQSSIHNSSLELGIGCVVIMDILMLYIVYGVWLLRFWIGK